MIVNDQAHRERRGKEVADQCLGNIFGRLRTAVHGDLQASYDRGLQHGIGLLMEAENAAREARTLEASARVPAPRRPLPVPHPKQYAPVVFPNGRTSRGEVPGTAGLPGQEAVWRDVLAQQLGGLVEVKMPGNGRADVVAHHGVIEVKTADLWKGAIRQVLDYADQTGCAPFLALYGQRKAKHVREVLTNLAGRSQPIGLFWLLDGTWTAVSLDTAQDMPPAPDITGEAFGPWLTPAAPAQPR